MLSPSFADIVALRLCEYKKGGPAFSEDMVREETRLWVEKYRPRAISEVAHQREVVSTLEKAVKESAGRGDLPHLLFYGPPGTGKTSTALALCRDLFGSHLMRSRVLELNASDERGIKVVRDKIKNFAQVAVSATASQNTRSQDGKNHPCPPFKVIVLDEADAITTDAQTALRRTMEAHSKVTRFILICNYVSRIIEPLTSRCAKFRFNPLPLPAMTDHLRKIAVAENVTASNETLEALIMASEGDLRKAINTLQSAQRMTEPGDPISMDDIATAACLVPDSVVDTFDVITCKRSSTHTAIRKAVDEILNEGYSALQLLSQYVDRLILGGKPEGVASLNDLQKSAVAIAVASAEKALIDGCDEQIQMYNVASQIASIVTNEDDIAAFLAA